MLVSEILKRHNRPVETIGPDQTVQEAIDKLVEKKIGSLLVCEEGGRIVGIITERDILRGSYSRSPRPEKVKVAERMTPDPVRGSPRDSVTELLMLMTRNRIRHVPITQGGKLHGLVSLGDLVAAQLDEIRDENHHLKDYIVQSGAVAP